ncbi:MAG: hypothetical protein GY754_01920, partial [bacterium]|nr:hypothetical protein [bacterium]
CVRDSCKDIISDFESNASQYEKLILGLAARGVSSSYHLFQGLFLHATRRKFSFDINSLIKLGKIILAKFKNNSRLHEQLTDFNFCKDRLGGFFPGSADGKPLRINVKAIKALISQKGSGIDGFTREVKIKLSNLLALKNEIESNYEFISYYYELKTLWYKSCMDRLTVMRKQNKIDDDVLELFGSIRSGFLDLKAAFLDRGINDFGPANCSYYELCSVVYMAAKFLNSVYFCSYNVTKARELDAQIRVLENYLGIRQWDIETS